MSAEPDAPGDRSSRDPFPKLESRKFSPRVSVMLPSLIASSRGTRFGTYVGKCTPTRESKMSLLLSLCGYRVRRGLEQLEMCGATGRWRAVPPPSLGEPVLDFLRDACECDWPLRPMDPNDERLDLVFSDQ